MRSTVILSTYEQPAWLEKALWGYALQSEGDFEVMVADDGSGHATREVIECCRRKLGLTIEHLWQPHEGFRKCTILNRAIEASGGDYLIFSDGDCIPRRDFVATHVTQARRGAFLSGGVLRLPKSLSHAVGPDDITSGRAFERRWLLAGECKLSRMRFKGVPRWAATFFDRITPTRATFNGHNASAWRSDIERVNGFDERMHYGGLDRELGERLMNARVQPLQIRHRAVCLHLDHPRDYVDQESLALNREIRWSNRLRHATWTDYGLVSGPRQEQPVILPFPANPKLSQASRKAA